MSGQAVGRVKPYVSTKSKIGIEKMLDDDPESFYYCKEVQKKGDFSAWIWEFHGRYAPFPL